MPSSGAAEVARFAVAQGRGGRRSPAVRGGQPEPAWWVWGLILATGLSTAVFLAATWRGIGILPDSARYMGISDVPYDAPLYAWLLMLVAQAGMGVGAAAKLTGFVLVVANGALVWHLLASTTGRIVPTAIGTGLVLLAPQVAFLHATAMSEPLFLFFILVALLAFVRYLETADRRWLFGCGLLIGLCALVRFTAPPLGLAVAGTLLMDRQRSWRARLADVAILTVLAGGMFLVWSALSEIYAGHSLGREFRFYGNMGAWEWRKSLEAMTAWLLPDRFPLALRAGLLAVVLAVGACLTVGQARVAAVAAQRTQVTARLLPATLGLFFVAYMLFMVLATSLEANLSLTGRYAVPPYVAAVLLLTIVVADRPRSALTIGLAGLGFVVLAGHVVRTTAWAYQAHRTGIGFAAEAWVASPTMRDVSRLPAGASVWSNAPDAIAYVDRRPAHWLPPHYMQRTGLPDPLHPYSAQVEVLRAELGARSGYLVFFDQVNWRPYLGGEGELVRSLGLRLVARERDGRIYTGAAAPR